MYVCSCSTPSFSSPSFSSPAIFHPCDFVRHFPVLQIPPLQFRPSFSSPANSTAATSSVIFQSCIFHPRFLMVRHFPLLQIPVTRHFQYSLCPSPSLHPHLSTRKLALFRACTHKQRSKCRKLEINFSEVVQQHYVGEVSKSITCVAYSLSILVTKYCRNRSM